MQEETMSVGQVAVSNGPPRAPHARVSAKDARAVKARCARMALEKFTELLCEAEYGAKEPSTPAPAPVPTSSTSLVVSHHNSTFSEHLPQVSPQESVQYAGSPLPIDNVYGMTHLQGYTTPSSSSSTPSPITPEAATNLLSYRPSEPRIWSANEDVLEDDLFSMGLDVPRVGEDFFLPSVGDMMHEAAVTRKYGGDV